MGAEGAEPESGIILVDDDPDEARLLTRVLKRAKVERPFQYVSSGEDALKFLRREEPYPDAFPVGLVLLDWRMPGMDGRATLEEIRSDPGLHEQVVVVLTTSMSQADVRSAFEAGANAFVIKPATSLELTTAVQEIENFWFRLSRIP